VAGADKLYLCAANGTAPQGHSLVLVACSPFRDREVAALGEGLGSVSVTANFDIDAHTAHGKGDDEDGSPASVPRESTALHGGTLPAPANFFDIRVYFSAPLSAANWLNGEDENSWLIVVSRPAVLYRRLFASSVGAGTYVHIALIATAIVFGLLELLACLMAFALSRTITGSIADIYEATKQIDRGNLDHRITVRRKDQLAALAGSFNAMAVSLKGLLKEQREKDRMQNELNIAQEVQNNLFPHTSIQLPDFEVYGVCEPARTIGGDYYDFIPFGETQLYLSLGDISGKGISAALLMASLHSAVRAYRGGESSDTPEFDATRDTGFCVSPGRLLELLNNHLLSSTQPEKYATLFLACYDSATRLLTYSNGGHLPPVILSANGDVKRLECGGSVVGLLEGMHYEEATIQLNPGDLLILYSDGLTEPEKDTVEFGETRLIEIVRSNQILPLTDIAARSLQAVRDWFGDAEQPDDMTLVLARLS
jgi:sigma-B regulation protein RsbU (phosphoserine phosphatase)